MSRVEIARALVSVYDKTGLRQLARTLHEAGVEIVSTGSTAAAITAAGLPVTPVESVTGFPECLGGRVKTLHPAIHAGLLADLRDPDHAAQLERQAIAPIQLLVSNLYPFADAVASGAPPAECIEQIDIGGPAMVRAAAKNHANVAVITSPDAYLDVAAALAAGGFTIEQRQRLAALAFGHVASYDAAVASWFAAVYAPDQVAVETGWPDLAAATWTRRDVLRYGENPHQRAALYTEAGAQPGIASAEQLHGKEMSYNNYVDADAAWRAANGFAEPCVAIVKHANPCGIALGTDIAQAHSKANACDPGSAFGGVIAANRAITAEAAAQIAEIFTEVIIAPDFEPAAIEILTRKKSQRLLRCPSPDGHGSGDHGGAPSPRWASAAASGDSGGPPSRQSRQRGSTVAANDDSGGPPSRPSGERGPGEHGSAPGGGRREWRQIGGGLLMQTPDAVTEPGDTPAGWTLAAGPQASGEELQDLAFAWRACRGVKSNAILLASDRASVGIGMGQVNRVDAARLAVARAGERAQGSVAASDAYFPFPDGLMVLADAGVRAVVQPGGSVRDPDVIAAAQEAGLTLYLTGVRHFWH